jgi:hypothetical protein
MQDTLAISGKEENGTLGEADWASRRNVEPPRPPRPTEHNAEKMRPKAVAERAATLGNCASFCLSETWGPIGCTDLFDNEVPRKRFLLHRICSRLLGMSSSAFARFCTIGRSLPFWMSAPLQFPTQDFGKGVRNDSTKSSESGRLQCKRL